MQFRIFPIGLVAVAASVLAACGGGGGSSSALFPAPQKPITQGESFKYAGSLAQVFIANSPNPQPTGTLNASVVQTTTIGAPTNFNNAITGGVGPVADFHTVETDSYPTFALSTTTDSYLQFPVTGGGNLVLVGSSSTDSNGNTITTSNGNGNGIIDVLPETTGSFGPNTATAQVNENDADGQTNVRKIAADGSYTETTNYPAASLYTPAPAPVQATITVKSDGTGSYSVPYILGFFVNPGGTNLVMTVATPAPVAGAKIPITLTYPPGTPGNPGPAPLIRNRTSVNWYPGGKPTLYTETDTDAGSTTIPASCNAATTFGTTATQIIQSIRRVDPVLGQVDTQTNTAYNVAGYGGPICVVFSDDLKSYYDFTGQESGNGLYTFNTTGLPMYETTTTETVGLSSLALHSAGRSVQSVASQQIMVAQGAFQLLLEKQRRQVAKQAIQSLLKGVAQ